MNRELQCAQTMLMSLPALPLHVTVLLRSGTMMPFTVVKITDIGLHGYNPSNHATHLGIIPHGAIDYLEVSDNA